MNAAMLESFASAGLVRRARKALDKSQPVLTMGDNGAVLFHFEGHAGLLDMSNPGNSQCDCHATGVCKHIIAATLFASAHPQTPPTSERVATGVPPHIDMDALLAEAGKAQVRRLYRLSEQRWDHQISVEQGQVCVTVNDHAVYFSQVKGMADLVCPEAARGDALLAVWLYCQSVGQDIHWPDWLMAEQFAHQQSQLHSRQVLCQACRGQLLQLARIPFEQWREESLLGMAALIIPMARQKLNVGPIKRLCGDMEQYVTGVGLRDNTRLLVDMAQTLVMLERSVSAPAIPPAPPSAPEQLVCLGGYPWQNAGGAHGVTLIFQDPQGQYVTWSESRRRRQQSLDYAGIWGRSDWLTGAPSGRDWFGHTCDIHHGELNGWQGLRQLQQTRVTSAAVSLLPHIVTSVDRINWQDKYVCFSPATVDLCEFDQARQSLLLRYGDQDGHRLDFTLPWSSLTHPAILNLLELDKQVPAVMVARIERENGRWSLRPCSVKLDSWVNLYFDTLPGVKKQGAMADWLIKTSQAAVPLPDSQTPVQRFLSTTLEKLAEHPGGDVSMLSGAAMALGLSTLSYYLNDKARVMEWPEARLRAAYCAEQLLLLSALKPVHKSTTGTQSESMPG